MDIRLYEESDDDDDDSLFKTIVNYSDEYINKVLQAYGEYNKIMERFDNIRYEDNIYCSLYLGDYIEKYVMEFLGGEPIPPEMEDRRDGILRRPIDFLLNYNGTKLKIKHLASCYRYGSLGGNKTFYWNYRIDFNYYPDYFLLSAWDTRKSIRPVYLWLIKKDQKLKNGSPFWRVDNFKLEDTKKRMEWMEQFQMRGIRLGVLQNIVAHAKKHDTISRLIDIRRDIYLKTGVEIDIKKLAKTALLNGLTEI